jgi:hypothetical protein
VGVVPRASKVSQVAPGHADPGSVFAGDCHGFTDPDRSEIDIWRPIVDRAGLASTRFHDLRHFFASQLIANGETAACVRDQMGHSSIHVTFDTYSHLFPGRGREASARYENRWMWRAENRKRLLAIGSEVIGKPNTSNFAVRGFRGLIAVLIRATD